MKCPRWSLLGKLSAIVLMVALAPPSKAQQGHLDISVDFNKSGDQFDIAVEQHSYKKIRAYIYQSGVAWTATTEVVTFKFHRNEASTVANVITGVNAGAYVEFTPVAATFAQQVTDWRAAVVVDQGGTLPVTAGRGTITIRPAPEISSTNTFLLIPQTVTILTGTGFFESVWSGLLSTSVFSVSQYPQAVLTSSVAAQIDATATALWWQAYSWSSNLYADTSIVRTNSAAWSNLSASVTGVTTGDLNTLGLLVTNLHLAQGVGITNLEDRLDIVETNFEDRIALIEGQTSQWLSATGYVTFVQYSNKLGAVDTSIAAAEADIDTLQTDVAGFASYTSSLSSFVTGYVSTITWTSTIPPLDLRIGGNETNISDLLDDVVTLFTYTDEWATAAASLPYTVWSNSVASLLTSGMTSLWGSVTGKADLIDFTNLELRVDGFDTSNAWVAAQYSNDYNYLAQSITNLTNNLQGQIDSLSGLVITNNGFVTTNGYQPFRNVGVGWKSQAGSTLLLNGDFTGNADNWTLGGGWSFDGGDRITIADGFDGNAHQNITRVDGPVWFTASVMPSTGVTWRAFGGAGYVQWTSPTGNLFAVIPMAGTSLTIYANNNVGSNTWIDDISIQPITNGYVTGEFGIFDAGYYNQIAIDGVEIVPADYTTAVYEAGVWATSAVRVTVQDDIDKWDAVAILSSNTYDTVAIIATNYFPLPTNSVATGYIVRRNATGSPYYGPDLGLRSFQLGSLTVETNTIQLVGGTNISFRGTNGVYYADYATTTSYLNNVTWKIPTVTNGTAYNRPNTMTSGTNGSEIVSAESIYDAAYSAFYAFDDSVATWWHAGVGFAYPEWIQYDFGATQAYVMGGYQLLSPNNGIEAAKQPTAWELQISTNGTDWGVIDSQTNVSSWSENETRTYWLSATNKVNGFQYVRLMVYTGASSAYMLLGDLNFILQDPTAYSTNISQYAATNSLVMSAGTNMWFSQAGNTVTLHSAASAAGGGGSTGVLYEVTVDSGYTVANGYGPTAALTLDPTVLSTQRTVLAMLGVTTSIVGNVATFDLSSAIISTQRTVLTGENITTNISGNVVTYDWAAGSGGAATNAANTWVAEQTFRSVAARDTVGTKLDPSNPANPHWTVRAGLDEDVGSYARSETALEIGNRALVPEVGATATSSFIAVKGTHINMPRFPTGKTNLSFLALGFFPSPVGSPGVGMYQSLSISPYPSDWTKAYPIAQPGANFLNGGKSWIWHYIDGDDPRLQLSLSDTISSETASVNLNRYLYIDAGAEITWNKGGADLGKWVIQGDTDTTLFNLDFGIDAIGIGIDPVGSISNNAILEVDGDIHMTSTNAIRFGNGWKLFIDGSGNVFKEAPDGTQTQVHP